MSTKHIILAAGHSLTVPGATYQDEKENLAAVTIVNEAAAYLKTQGVHVTVVPHELDYVASVAWINSFWTDDSAAFEIHKNRGSETARRMEVYYQSGDYFNQSEAERLARELAAATTQRSIALPDTSTHVGKLWWCRGLHTKTKLLVEMGFLEAPDDEKQLGSCLGKALIKWAGIPIPTKPKRRRKMQQYGKKHKWILIPEDRVHVVNPDSKQTEDGNRNVHYVQFDKDGKEIHRGKDTIKGRHKITITDLRKAPGFVVLSCAGNFYSRIE